MSDEKVRVEREIIVATEPIPAADQRRLGRPMVMLIVLIVVALAGIGITVAVMSN
jgi:flagellar basal body-associated protein FliL